jgi:hypothetical protein
MRMIPLRLVLPFALLGCSIGTALAQYKVVAPDGRVTYTDRPPADTSLKVIELGRPSPPAADTGPALPADLQRLSSRFPVVLFTAGECAPCDSGRDLLKLRGVPYSERLVVSNDDIAALERTVGGRTLPALTVGGQALRGFSAADWSSYLDAAGYPRQSRLPRGWAPPTPQPLVAAAPAAPVPAPRAAEPVPEAPAPALPTAEAASSPIRF